MNRRDLLKAFVALCVLSARLLHCQGPVCWWKEAEPAGSKFDIQGLPLPIVHKDFAMEPRSLASVARARGLDEKTIREIEEYEQGLKRYLWLKGFSVKSL